VEAFLGIVESKCLWLTSVFDTNDKSEFSLLRDRCISKIQHSLDENNAEHFINLLNIWNQILSINPHICSFSKTADQLSQWRGYGDMGHGVAIGFNRNFFALTNCSPEISVDLHKALGICDVVYLKDEDDIALNEFINYITAIMIQKNRSANKSRIISVAMEVGMELNRYSVINKHFSFEEEGEVRIIYNPPFQNMSERDANNYRLLESGRRIARGKIRPYYKYFYPKHSLIEVITGSNCDLKKEDIRGLLCDKRNGFDSVHIRSSGCPFRD
jgi:hypothetical protein